MEPDMKNPKQKKGFWAAIWESMTKTGGCCGSGSDCCCSAQPAKDKEQTEKKNDAPSTCCGK